MSLGLGDRSAFPKLQPRSYLNHAAIAPVSVFVREAVERVLEDYERRGVAAVFDWVEQRGRLKAILAQLIGAEPAEIALSPSTTRGLMDIALCFPWQAGDRVLLFAGEFPANVTPWQQVAREKQLTTRMHFADAFRTQPEQAWHDFMSELEGGVRLVAVSAVQFQTGHRMPIARMAEACHAHGAQICVDAIQALGVVPLNVQQAGIDYLACGSQKWLMGMEGLGFVYVQSARTPELVPVTAGWLSHEDPLAFLFEGAGRLSYDRPIRRSIDFMEGSATNAMGAAALEASVTALLKLGVPAIHGHVQTFLDRLEPPLAAMGFESRRSELPAERSGILSLAPPSKVDVVELHARLMQAGVSCTLPDGLLRFSPHFSNSLDEVPSVVEAVSAALAEL